MAKTKHGHVWWEDGKKHKTATYIAWQNMKARCLRDPYYTSKGVTVCKEWLNSFETFLADMGLRPSKKHSLDRVDNLGGYSKGNCRWATIEQQLNNRSPYRKRDE